MMRILEISSLCLLINLHEAVGFFLDGGAGLGSTFRRRSQPALSSSLPSQGCSSSSSCFLLGRRRILGTALYAGADAKNVSEAVIQDYRDGMSITKLNGEAGRSKKEVRTNKQAAIDMSFE